ncbi:MAG: OsmC family protein [Armatimonadota bacterium]
MRITSKLTGGELRFESEVRGHTMIVDQPAESGGDDTGPTPPELFVTALGTCVGVYAVHFCKKHSISTEGLVVHTDWNKATGPARLSDMSVSIELPAGVPDEKLGAFMKTVEQCLIHNTICHTSHVDIKLLQPVEA